jgi:hypothetical protein
MRRYEQGNVILIVLVALAVFAALAYAVMKPSRTVQDNADVSVMVNSAMVTQFPKMVHKSVIRLITEGVALENQEFNAPDTIVDPKRSIFHEDGGKVTYANAPSTVMAGDAEGTWSFNMNFEIDGLSSSAKGIAGNEMIAFLSDVNQTICEQVNQEMGIMGIPATPNYEAAIQVNQTNETTINQVKNVSLKSASGNEFDGKLYGCLQNGGLNGPYVFYYVLAQR